MDGVGAVELVAFVLPFPLLPLQAVRQQRQAPKMAALFIKLSIIKAAPLLSQVGPYSFLWLVAHFNFRVFLGFAVIKFKVQVFTRSTMTTKTIATVAGSSDFCASRNCIINIVRKARAQMLIQNENAILFARNYATAFPVINHQHVTALTIPFCNKHTV